ncbi:MAG: phage tail tape measure protein [Motiliproteus sp.]
MQSLEKLFFAVGLKDQVSSPIGKIDKAIGGMKRNAVEGFTKIAGGSAGLYATGMALESILGPAKAMDRAIGEVKSLGVADKEIKALTETALQFSIKYGESATDFVRSSYDIQSAIAGLNNGELAKFTEASNLLAKATKADAGTITSYMGTMYGIFSAQANAIGKDNWVQQLTGQTATAVQMFKTDGQNMSAAFTSLGADGQAAGIQLSEQMAVLGTLQATMSGSEAGTKYRAFLTGVGNAQDKLGLSFTDSHGRMLPMVQILKQLQGQFGDTLDVAESDALKKAFGSDQAVGMIKLLMKDTGGLANNINALGKVTGMEKAQLMAKSMADPFEQMGAAVTAVKIGLGQVLLPAITPVIQAMTEGGATVTRWTHLFPNLTKVVGFAALGIMGVVAAFSMFAIVGGMAQLAAVGMTPAVWLLSASWGFFKTALLWSKGALLATHMQMVLMGPTMAAMKLGMFSAAGSVWSFTAALLANPMTWVVIGVVALIAAVAGLIIYWDELKAAFMDSSWGKGLMNIVSSMVGWFTSLGGVFDWVMDKLEVIPGIEFDRTEVPALESGRTLNVPSGGLQQQLGGGGSSTNYGDVHISGGSAMGPAELEEWQAMEGA